LIYEDAIADVPSTKQRLADFLNVAADRFPPGAGGQAVNQSYVPWARRAYSLAFQVGSALRNRDLDWVVNTAKALGIKKVFGVGDKPPPMAVHTRECLRAHFEPEIRELEGLLGIPLEAWR
jgi:hypothetical protein